MQANAHTHARTHTYMFMYVLFQTHRQDVMFTGTLTAQDQVNQWIQDKCVPPGAGNYLRKCRGENSIVQLVFLS